VKYAAEVEGQSKNGQHVTDPTSQSRR
jgi:hypothetical protein